MTFFSRRFRRKSRLLQWLVFFRQFNAIGPLFCLFVQHHQLELRTSKTYSKRQKFVQNKNIDVQNLENIGSHPLVFFTRIFSALCDFFWSFLDSTKVSPLGLFRSFATQWMSKNPKGSPLLHFSALWHFKNLIFKFLNLFFHKAQRVPLLQFWALDIAPTLAVPGLFFFRLQSSHWSVHFLETFLKPPKAKSGQGKLSPKGPPSIFTFSRKPTKPDVPKGSPFYIFRHYATFFERKKFQKFQVFFQKKCLALFEP